MKTTFLLLWGMLAIAQVASAGSPTENFKLVKKDNVVSLYERWIPGNQGESVRELKAVFEVRSGIGEIVSLLQDPALVREWNSGVMDCAIQPASVGGAWLYYVRYDIPWPFSNQDCLLRYQLLAPHADTTAIRFHSVRDKRFPVPKGFERITHVRGQWLITAEGPEKVKVTYLITTDRSKQIPRWVSDPVIHLNVFNTMTNFKRLLEERS